MIEFLIFAAGSISRHIFDQYQAMSPEERAKLREEFKELGKTVADKKESFQDFLKRKLK
jgi:hypothetical protein